MKPGGGKVFGRWLVLREGPMAKHRHRRFWCRCACGIEKLVYQTALISGTSTGCTSCGDIIHGWAKTPTYKTWENMHSRCKSDPLYVGRGITVCQRWRRFENFLADMGRKPTGRSLDRRDNDKGYSVDNCRWATPRQQANNVSSNVCILYQGQTHTLAEWARHLGMTRRAAGHFFGVPT